MTQPRRQRQRGITLIEMIVVVTLIGIMTALATPAMINGLDSIRLSSSCDAVVAFLNTSLNRAQRGQKVVELVIERSENRLVARSADLQFQRTYLLPDGITIVGIRPEVPDEFRQQPRRFLLLPGSVPPHIGVILRSRRGSLREVTVDPISGAPRIIREVHMPEVGQ